MLFFLKTLWTGGENIRSNLRDAKNDGSVLRVGVTDTTTWTPAQT